MQDEIDIKEVFDIIWKNKIFIIILSIMGAILGMIYNSKIIVPKYESKTSIILSVKEEILDESTNTITNDEIQLNERLINTYTQIIKSESVIKKVKNNLELKIDEKEISNNIQVKQKEESTVLEIIVQNTDAEISKKIAEQLPEVFFEELKDLYNIRSAKILDYPKLATEPYNLNATKYILIGTIGASMFGILVCVIKLLLNENIRFAKDVEEKLNIPVLVEIGKVKEKNKFVALKNNNAFTEIFRILIANIKYFDKKTILITSNSAGEGKSWITSNLAVTYAKSGKKVLLIDSDMRRGRQDNIFWVKNSKGLSDIIANEETEDGVKNYIKSTIIDNLDIITRGNANIDYSKLLFSNSIKEILKFAKKEYNYILIDGTPYSLVADNMAICNLVDTTILVTKYDNTSVKDLKRIKSNIETSGGEILGIIINQIDGISKKYEECYYSYNPDNSLQSVNNKIKRLNNLRKRIN